MEWELSVRATLKWQQLLEVWIYIFHKERKDSIECCICCVLSSPLMCTLDILCLDIFMNFAVTPALILGFNVSSTKQIAALAKSKGIHLLSHNIIYKLLDALKVKYRTIRSL